MKWALCLCLFFVASCGSVARRNLNDAALKEEKNLGFGGGAGGEFGGQFGGGDSLGHHGIAYPRPSHDHVEDFGGGGGACGGAGRGSCGGAGAVDGIGGGGTGVGGGT